VTRARRRLPAPGGLRILPSPARAGGLLGLVVALLAGYGLVTAPAFAVRSIDVSPLRWTARDELVQWLGLAPDSNAFRVSTSDLAARVEHLPTVRSAGVSIALPDRLVVAVTERTPIVAWKVGGVTFLVDRDGMPFRWFPTGDAAVAGLPAIDDRRSASRVVISVGSLVDPVDLDVATRLLSLTPADLGSAAQGLAVAITDDDGFVLTTHPGSWTAVFGSYGKVLRPPDLIPGQVRLLRSLLSGREGAIARVVLADDRNGTYVPIPSPG